MKTIPYLMFLAALLLALIPLGSVTGQSVSGKYIEDSCGSALFPDTYLGGTNMWPEPQKNCPERVWVVRIFAALFVLSGIVIMSQQTEIDTKKRPDSGPRGRVRAVTDDYWGVIVVALIVIVCLVGWFDIYDKVREFEYEDLKPIWQSGFVQFLAHIFLWPFLINSDIWVNDTMYLGKGEANPELASPGYWAYLWRMVLTNTNCILVGVFILGIGSFIAGIVADSASRVKRMFGKKKTNNL